MYKINDERTQKLLEGLRTDEDIPVELEEFNSLLRNSGVIVDITASRQRLSFNLDLKSFGVDVNSLQTKEFVSDHITASKLSVLPLETEKKLTRIYDAARYAKKKRAVFGEEFILVDSMPELKEEFYKFRKEYFDLRDSIIAQWPILIGNFQSDLMSMLDELDVEIAVKEEIFRSVFDKIPTSENYRTSFEFGMKIKAVPVVDFVDGFDAGLNQAIAESTEDELIRTAYASIAHCFSETVALCNRILSQEGKGTISLKTRAGIEPLYRQLCTRNVFKNPQIDEIAKMISFCAAYDDDDLIATCGQIEGKVWRYCNECNLELSENFILPVSLLKTI